MIKALLLCIPLQVAQLIQLGECENRYNQDCSNIFGCLIISEMESGIIMLLTKGVNSS